MCRASCGEGSRAESTEQNGGPTQGEKVDGVVLLGHAKGLFLTVRTIKQQEGLGTVAQT